jgi:ABC-2 type transport system ATP-binding protein
MKDCIVKAENIVKQYGNHIALNKINISIPRGCIYGLLGPNGAGKTTLMRILNQITMPDSGKVMFDNELLQKNHISEIGYLPEERGLYKKMKVGEQALYLAQLKGMSYLEAKKLLQLWFEKLNILNWWHKKVEDLSKGMAQKIQFIVTIIHQPKLLIFDEPFSGFDPINAAIIREEIIDLKKKGTTIIFSTHRMESVEEICDYIGLINNAQTILEGSISEIKSQYNSNDYEIIVNGEIIENQYYKILKKHKKTYTIHVSENLHQKEFLKLIMKNAEIISFNKKTPSVEDIFIKAVNNE